eukprot:g15153.t1
MEIEEVHFAGSPLDHILSSVSSSKAFAKLHSKVLMAYGLHQLLLATVCGLSLASSPNLRASINVTEAFERNFTMGNASARHLWAPPPKKNGYRYLATTTRYGTNPFTACGLDSGALVKGGKWLRSLAAETAFLSGRYGLPRRSLGSDVCDPVKMPPPHSKATASRQPAAVRGRPVSK